MTDYWDQRIHVDPEPDPVAMAARISRERKNLRALSEVRCQRCRKRTLIAGVYIVDGQPWLWMPPHEPFRQAKDGARRWHGDPERGEQYDTFPGLNRRPVAAAAVRVVAPANLTAECPTCQRPTRMRLVLPGALIVEA